MCICIVRVVFKDDRDSITRLSFDDSGEMACEYIKAMYGIEIILDEDGYCNCEEFEAFYEFVDEDMNL